MEIGALPEIVDFFNPLFYNKRYMGVLDEDLSG